MEVILNGEIIEEYPEDKYGPSCLIFGRTRNGRAIHVQCSLPPTIWVITLYEPEPDEWIEFRKRRECPHMKCLVCQSDMVKKKVTVDFRAGDDLFVVEKVPAIVCTHCGERVFAPEITRSIQSLAKKRKNPRRTIAVPVFSLDKAVL
jgi:YgiT-type zinc finger domain-containing protein